MTRDELGAAARSLPHRALALHLVAAAALLAATWHGLDGDGTALMVLRGVAVLLAAALALSVDEPAAAVLDATPTPMVRRLAGRVLCCALVVVPAWLAALGLAALRGADVPVAALTLEACALGSLAVAVPLALRRWWRVLEPAVVAGPLLLGGLVAAAHLPRDLVLLAGSPADPAWDAAHARWSLLLVGGLALLVAAAAEPATAPTRRPLLSPRRG